jgi:hypothetical protein
MKKAVFDIEQHMQAIRQGSDGVSSRIVNNYVEILKCFICFGVYNYIICSGVVAADGVEIC